MHFHMRRRKSGLTAELSDAEIETCHATIIVNQEVMAALERDGKKDSPPWLAAMAQCVWAYAQIRDTQYGPQIARSLVSAVRRMGLEASDTGTFAFNHLTVFAYLLRQIGDFSGATRLDRAALSYLDRMGGALNDEYADTVSALALDFVRLGSNAEAIELLDSYKTSLNATNRRLSSRERAALADLIRYRRSAG